MSGILWRIFKGSITEPGYGMPRPGPVLSFIFGTPAHYRTPPSFSIRRGDCLHRGCRVREPSSHRLRQQCSGFLLTGSGLREGHSRNFQAIALHNHSFRSHCCHSSRPRLYSRSSSLSLCLHSSSSCLCLRSSLYWNSCNLNSH